MSSDIEQFSKAFAMNLKEERATVKRHGRAHLSKTELALIKYYVTASWWDGKKHPVKRTPRTVMLEVGLSRTDRAQEKLDKLIAEKLLIPTGEGGEYIVDVSPMKDWKSVRQLAFEKKRRMRMQQAEWQKEYRVSQQAQKQGAERIHEKVTVARVRNWNT